MVKMPPRKKVKVEETKPAQPEWLFFENFPPNPNSQPSIVLDCPDGVFHLDPIIAKICSPFIKVQQGLIVRGRKHIELHFPSEGVNTFVRWAGQHEAPVFTRVNDEPGDVLDHFIIAYATAMSLQAHRLCNLLFKQVCKVGRLNKLEIRNAHIADAFARADMSLVQNFLVAMISYQQRSGIAGPFLHGAKNKAEANLQNQNYDDTPAKFKYELMREQSEGKELNPCLEPENFYREFVSIADDDESLFETRE